MKKVIIQGSSRSDGNTNMVSKELQKLLNCDLIDLNKKEIGHYDYEYKNQDDDFPALIERIANNYDILIFTSPVYWYTMSGRMKVFFDRISDTIRINKDTGRKLRGKHMAAISCGYGSDAIEGFFLPFQKSSDYLGINYIGDLHTWVQSDELDKEVKSRIEKFAKKIQEVKITENK